MPITERTFAFAVRIVKMCRQLGKRGAGNRRILDQVLRSGTFIGTIVEESQAGQSRADFIHKYLIALKEARETRYWLRLLIAAELVEEKLLQPLVQEADEIAKIIAAIFCTTRRNTKT